jgi:hypothetical protein
MFSYSITATKDNSTRTGVMVGTSPYAKPLTASTISTVIVPVQVIIDNMHFDPTAPNSCDSGVSAVSRFENSPLDAGATNLTFNGVNVGTTQYVNGFRRAEFWSTIGGSTAYQNTLSPIVVAARETTRTGDNGITHNKGYKLLGIVSQVWLEDYLTSTLLPKLKKTGVLEPSRFAIILLKNVVQSSASPPTFKGCCILGYHTATGNPAQIYAVADYDTTGAFEPESDAAPFSHEIAESMDDPLGTNATPAWGGEGQVPAGSCQDNWKWPTR